MRKYDKEGNHKLDKNELGVMLQDLAGGEQPTEDELRWEWLMNWTCATAGLC